MCKKKVCEQSDFDSKTSVCLCSVAIDGLRPGADIPDCSLKQFACGNGQCIPYKWVCEGESDCKNNSDESDEVCNRNCTAAEFQCDSGLCIPKEWACDKDANCADSSDENSDYCDRAGRCREGQFDCGGPDSCIPDSWKCDGKKDCPDGSDESGCQVTCKSDQFACGDGACVADQYVCDSEEDCSDGSDERNCTVRECGPDDFLCPADNKCFPKAWKCDGQMDCSDGADEEGCVYSAQKKYPHKECTATEWLCADRSTCISNFWLCDDDVDCKDGSDEAPDLCKNLICRADQFQCKNKQCIPGIKHCDKVHDCLDNSDEENCDSGKVACGTDQFDCGEGMCLSLSNVCDGHADCPGNEDEPADLCGKNECAVGNGGCSHGCVDDTIGYHCTCHTGYFLADNRTCHDTDECQEPGTCSHTCINTVGSFKCECDEGYVREPSDPTFCKAMHGSGSIIFSKRQDIRKYTLDHHQLTPIVEDSKGAAAMDFVYKTGTIFWMDTSNHTIFKAPIDAGFHKTIVIGDNIKESDGLAVDWIYDHIYWTDTGKNTIEVANFDGSYRKVLIGTGIDEPRSIAVNPLDGWLYWSDWGDSARIERAGMDGSHRTVIVSHNIRWPNGITLDLVKHKIYWVDAKLNLLSSANYDGSGRRSILKSKEYLHLPHSLTIFEDTVYWADWDKQTIFKANKFDGSDVQPLIPRKMVHNPMIVHVFHPYKQPQGINHCVTLNDRCSHLCLPAPLINSRSPKISCSCPDGMTLQEDSTVCVPEAPETRQPQVTRAKAKNVEDKVIDIELELDDESGYVMIVFVAVSSVVVSLGAGLLFVVYRHYIHKNVTSMNFENFVYKKTTTTNDSYPRKSSAATSIYKPPSTIQVTDDSRVPLNPSQTTELV